MSAAPSATTFPPAAGAPPAAPQQSAGQAHAGTHASARAPGKPRRPLAIALVALAVGLGGFGVWDAAIKPHVIPKRFGVVDEGRIYRSGRLTPATLAQVVREREIRTIIDLGADPVGSVADARMQRAAQALGVTRYRMNLEGDATGNPNYYVWALRLMNDPANQPVLVHCGAGTQRTGCVVWLHREINQQAAPESALAEAKQYDYDPRDNPKLIEMVQTWGPAIEQALRAGPEAQVPTAPERPKPMPVGGGG